jgi:hypothetical protein
MSKNDVFTTPEILDVTEVETTKIIAKEETAREAIKQAEETKRNLSNNSTAKWRDSGFQWMLGVTMLIIFASITISVVVYCSFRYPPPVRQPDVNCTESRKIIPNNQPASCLPGQKMVATGQGFSDMVVECKCQ